jgi:hypothetical protein
VNETASWSSSVLTGAAVAGAGGASMFMYLQLTRNPLDAMTPAEEGFECPKRDRMDLTRQSAPDPHALGTSEVAQDF